ncbi:MAG TPA: toxin HipA, partial [Porphyromonadaceae bacterium]|nr:toxin HipA [Porphyromonadaceae bacterium]
EEKAMREILKIGTSAGGARPKAVIAYNEKTGEVRSGQTRAPEGFEHWLLKLDGVSEVQLGATHGYGRVEYAYYLMALDCGIEMMPCRLLEENGRAHFMTRRFDREG